MKNRFTLLLIFCALSVLPFLKNKHRRLPLDIVVQSLDGQISSDDNKQYLDNKQDLLRYLRVENRLQEHDSFLIYPISNVKYDIEINHHRVGTVTREQIESYFYGRTSE
jgi:hypothetical protein